MAQSSGRRILLVDAYDSFTNNLSALLSTITSAEIHLIHMDTFVIDQLRPHLASFDAVVIGPGPGSPENEKDVGVIKDIWTLSEEDLLPVFGVCLGFQSLCLHHGAKIGRLNVVKHGQSSTIHYKNSDIFENAGLIHAIRYHSLYADLATSSELEELGYADDGVENGWVSMAVRHVSKPFWGVQYHPESICTTGGGDRVIGKWWQNALTWSQHRTRMTLSLSSDWKIAPRPCSLLRSSPTGSKPQSHGQVKSYSLYAPFLSISRVCELLGAETAQDFVLLESGANPGRFSIVGCLIPGQTDVINYVASDCHISLSKVGNKASSIIDLCGDSVWSFVAKYMSSRRALGGDEELPFWGGLVGYLTYEMGVTSLNVALKRRTARTRRPDVNLAFIERSIVYDLATHRVHVLTLLPDDDDWLRQMKFKLQEEAQMSITPSTTPPPCRSSASAPLQDEPEEEDELIDRVTFTRPEQSKYIQKVKDCQAELAAGESYELCLTAPTKIRFSRPASSPWSLYSRLRVRNPAPYAAYFSLNGSTIVGSSPERFLSWDRNGLCQLRPIKGTVRKTTKAGRHVTRAEAEAVLNTPKEMAENLMIVDLIRHDLSGVAAKGSVNVLKLMEIEEYETVYQLVSVIEGTLDNYQRNREGFTGIDVLARSLPPGSMTGAPKKRSVEILQVIEETERGIYSGVLGYFSVCGGGDWSVIIRSAFSHRVDNTDDEVLWTIGAGGAITALSSPEDEWEEMVTKLDSTQTAFAASTPAKQ